MGFRQNLARFIAGPTQRKQDDAMRAILAVGPYTTKWMQTDYATFAREGYSSNPYVYACIRQIAMAVSGIPWKVYNGEAKKKAFADHPLLDLIHRPNPRQSQGKFFETMVGYLMLDGNNYIERAGGKRGETGPPDELYCLRPDRMTILPGTLLEPVAGYKYKVQNFEVGFPANRILHQRFFNPLDDWYGLSPMQAAARTVDQSNYATSWNVALLQNGAKPTGALQTPLAIDDVQYARLKGMIEEQYTGMTNAGRPLILEGGLQWQEMGMSPLDMAWIDSQKMSARQIAMVYNIAPELIGDPEAKTFSNYAEARKALYEENILPLMDWLRDDLNQWLSPLYDNQTYLDYDRDEIEALAEDRNAVAKRNDASFAAGWITINDARKLANMPADPKYGDFYRWQLPSFAAMDPLAEQPQVQAAPSAKLPHPELPPTHPFNQPAGQEGNPPPGQSPEKPQEGVAKPTPSRPAVKPGAKSGNGHSHDLDQQLMQEIAQMR